MEMQNIRSMIISKFPFMIKIQRWHSDKVIYILSYPESYYIIYIVLWSDKTAKKCTTAISFRLDRVAHDDRVCWFN